MKSVTIRAMIVLACWLAASGTNWGATWVEVGDAGDHFDSQVTEGIGNLTHITGTIGEAESDAFLFGYGGAPGPLNITATFDDPPPPSLLLLVALFDELGVLLAGDDDLDGSVTVLDLPAGLYVVEAAVPHGQDPPYTIELSGPVGPQGVVFGRSVPEPGAAATLTVVAASAMLVRMRRRRSGGRRLWH